MFESIKDALSNKGGNYKDILKTEIGKTYTVRFIANTKVKPIQTFYHYHHHTWTSKSTGQYVNGLCPTTWGDRCPICEQRFKLYKSGTEQDKALATLINRKENWLTNCYVISDGSDANNNGTVKILRFGKQVKDIIMQAVEGDDAKEIGADAIFDLSEKGCNFRIKVEKNEGGYPTYIFSKFLNKGPIDGMTPEKIKEAQNAVYDLTKLFESKTAAELTEMVNVHLLCKEKVDDFPPVEEDVTVPNPVNVAAIANAADNLPGLEPVETGNSSIDDLIKDL